MRNGGARLCAIHELLGHERLSATRRYSRHTVTPVTAVYVALFRKAESCASICAIFSDGSRIKLSKDIQPLTTFRNHSVEMMRQLRESQRPIVLTVNGKPEAVIQDVEAYQRLLDLAAFADEPEGIRQGEENIRAGRTRPAEEFFAAFEAKHGMRG